MDESVQAAVVGVGETPPVKRSAGGLEPLVVRACREALDDAGLLPADVDGLVTEGMVAPQLFAADRCEEALGLDRVRYQVGVSKSGAGIVGSLGVAANAIAAGEASVVLTYFGVDWGSQRRSGGGSGPANARLKDPRIDSFERPYGNWPQVVWFGGIAQRYLERYNRPESDLGAWTVMTRENARSHDYALEKAPLTVADHAESPYVSEPLRRADCSLLNDGAAAAVITSLDRAAGCRKQPVRIAGCAAAHNGGLGRSSIVLDPELLHTGAAAATQRALSQAGMGLDDIGFAQVYDCFSIAAMLQVEDMGLFERGTAGQEAARGAIRFDGSLPVNTHGGLLSNSYVLGIGHIVEAVRQVRRERGPGQVLRSSAGVVAGYGGAETAVVVLAAG